MANLNKQKEVLPEKVEESRPPETPEERTKRLRKEDRRKLRVSFKPDESLVEIRTFVHDPEEDMGHEGSLVRDVGDSRGEGQMLKMHKDLDLMDEEEDGVTSEQILALWKTPSCKVLPCPAGIVSYANAVQVIDFSVIDSVELDRNYTTRGGRVEVKSHERAVQEQRELNSLMVVYTTLADIPPSPRELLEEIVEETLEQPFGSPSEEIRVSFTAY